MILIAKVGTNVEGKRFEVGERITGVTLTGKQLKYLIDNGYAEKQEPKGKAKNAK